MRTVYVYRCMKCGHEVTVFYQYERPDGCPCCGAKRHEMVFQGTREE